MSGRTFAYVQATEGLQTVHEFATAWRDMRAAGLLRGAWHALRSDEHPVEQAVVFLKALDLQRGDLPPVLDVTGLDLSRQTVEPIRTWISVVESELEARHGHTVTMMIRAPAVRRCLRELGDHELWVIDRANYEKPTSPDAWDGTTWTVHQYTRAIRGLPGAGDHAHLDKFNILKLLDRGRRVEHLKRSMCEVGLGFGVTDTDEFDQSTHDAVLRFQAARGLVQDGLVGPKTFAELKWPS